MATSMCTELRLRIYQNSPQFRKFLSRWQSQALQTCNHSTSAVSAQRSQSKVVTKIEDEEEFRVYDIPGALEKSFVGTGRRKEFYHATRAAPPRYLKMRTDQDWTNVWPSAQTFKWSVVPFPVRQGFIKRPTENQGIPPGRYGNAELMKIPNFLHLTPGHVKKHCAAIKQFCNPWPVELQTDEQCEEHFPVEVITSDYCTDGPSVRDERACVVKFTFKFSSLKLNAHADDKMKRLVSDRYDKETDRVTIVTDRCPLKKQNYDFSQYLMIALYFESNKVEPWESEITEADNRFYVWSMTQSYQSMLQLVSTLKQTQAKVEYLSELPPTPSTDHIVELKPVKQYQDAVTHLHDNGETQENIDNYKKAVASVLNVDTTVE